MDSFKKGKEHCFFALFSNFILNSKRGRRLQPNGKRYSEGTIRNYTCTLKLLASFCTEKGFTLRIREAHRLTKREREVEKNYWKRFYQRFTEYLYTDLGYYDNYVGQNIRILKAFFNDLNKEGKIKPGDYYKYFYVRKEEIAIFPLVPEELNYLIYDATFESSLPPRLLEAKDVFVFGCTVALRVSDLLALKKRDVRIVGEKYYLAVRSKKTATDTLVSLPPYCINIIEKYRRKKNVKGLLPHFNIVNLNQYIKQLLEKAGFTQEVCIKRERMGKPIELKATISQGKAFRFCDVASTHTMRRTAITSLLCLGLQEEVVRKISGHAPGSKEFYRYVRLAQVYQDQETEAAFLKLKSKVLYRESDRV